MISPLGKKGEKRKNSVIIPLVEKRRRKRNTRRSPLSSATRGG